MTLYMSIAARADVDTLGADPEYEELMAVINGAENLYLEKMWDAVRSLFDDDLDPVFCGEPVTDDIGYGPATFVGPDKVNEVVSRYSTTTADEFRSRFSPTRLEDRGAYPNIWDRDDEMPMVEDEAVELAEAVVALYQQANTDGKGILVVMM